MTGISMRAILLITALSLPAPLPAETITLLSDPWCPFACDLSNPQPGYMVEIARAVFEPLGHHIQYRVVPFARAEQEVLAGRAHGFVGVLKLPRRMSFHFPKEEQGLARVCFFTLPDMNWRYQGADSLKGLRVGSASGYSYGNEIDAVLHSRGTKLDAVSGNNALQLNLEKLGRHRVDVVVEYAPVMAYMLTHSDMELKNAGCSSGADPLYIAFSPRQPNSRLYAKQLSAGMERLRRNGKLTQILTRYGLSDWKLASTSTMPSNKPPSRGKATE
jgi:polar amino acid transport system substrate-binding protein